MANKGYLPTSHHLLSGYASLTSPRSALGPPSRVSPPPEFSYDSSYTPRDSPRNSSAGRDLARSSYNRATPTSPGSSALSMAYSSVQDFPYGLSGVQMPTYNFGSELYNYVSNGFPRKSRMCTFCNKVFTRSTTRRYHERRCPLLRASNSLAKNEENNSTASLTALKEQQLQQRQKECRSGGGVNHSNATPLPRTLSSNISNTMANQAGSLPQASPPLPGLHPAYPTSFPKTAAAVVSNASRSSAYNYPHPYSSHFYNSLSAVALASLDQNSKKQQQQQQQDSDSLQWSASAGSPPNSSSLQDQVNSFSSKLGSALTGSGPLSLSKAFTSEAVVDLTARYCADFSLRTRPPVFPAPSLRAQPQSPPSPEPGETKGGHSFHEVERRDSQTGDSNTIEIVSVSVPPLTPGKSWSSMSHREVKLASYNSVCSSSSLEEERQHRRHSASPSSDIWHEREEGVGEPRPYMKVEPLDEDDEEEFEDEEDEEEVEEDEEQFKSDTLTSDAADAEVQSLNYKGRPYNPLICQYCKKIFADVIARKAHEELHAQKKLFACCLCSHSFHCAYSLRIHTLRQHKDGPYKCKYCFLDHASAGELRSHLVDEHSLPKAERQSLKYFNLLTDSSSHSEQAVVNNAVSDGEHDALDRETSHSHGLPHRRSASHSHQSKHSYSQETTKSLLSPDNNMADLPNNADGDGERDRDVTGDKAVPGEGMEACKICNKSFTKSYIRLHERTHADQKPYECPICNKRFGYKNNMKSHMKLHQGLKPYQCQICGARFTRGSTLRRHGRRHNVSHGAMLDYVLFDHHRAGGGRGGVPAGPQKYNLGHPSQASGPAAVPDGQSQYVLPSQNSHAVPPVASSAITPSADSLTAIHSKHSAFTSMPGNCNSSNNNSIITASGILDADRYTGNSTGGMKQRSPSRISPPHPGSNSPRGSANPFPSHTSIAANPMVGNLAAVAAANLFGYPNAAAAAAAPHLYQFYASAAAAGNPLMAAYPGYSTNQSAHSVQSDALNLSMGKRKSPDKDRQDDFRSEPKHQRVENNNNSKLSPASTHRASPDSRATPTSPDRKDRTLSTSAAIKSEHGGSVSPHRKEHANPFTPSPLGGEVTSDMRGDYQHNLQPKTEPDTQHSHSLPQHHQHHDDHRSTSPPLHNNNNDHDNTQGENLKICTEDFGAQVNICCPSPRVQSSTGSVHLSTSPVGSSSGPDGHLHGPAGSPTGGSQASSPVNSAPSPSSPHDSCQDLLVSLMTSGRLFRCSFCDIYFTEYAMFRLHQKYHQSDQARPFLCAVCGEDCKDKTYFTVHLSDHLGLGPKNCLP